MKKRYLEEQIREDLKRKMVFLGGPRQVGKTTLAKGLGPAKAYLNWDAAEDRERILTRDLPNSTLWIFDEIHKYKSWRGYLKGLYDKNGDSRQIIVTGSARLDYYRRGGDSLQGRYHYLRLHPLTADELGFFSERDLRDLLKLGGFPEPFLSGSEIDSRRWSREYRQRLFQEDILSIEAIEDLGNAELLMLRLPDLVGSPLSINALREDLQVSFKAVARWIEIFERFYSIFRVAPFGSPRIKSAKKEQKHYHFDWTLVKKPGARFENMIASHLLKWCHFLEDTEAREMNLSYFRDREQREVDFVVTEDRTPLVFVEVKLSDEPVSKDLRYLKGKFPDTPSFQISAESKKDFVDDLGIRVGPARILLEEIKSQIFRRA